MKSQATEKSEKYIFESGTTTTTSSEHRRQTTGITTTTTSDNVQVQKVRASAETTKEKNKYNKIASRTWPKGKQNEMSGKGSEKPVTNQGKEAEKGALWTPNLSGVVVFAQYLRQIKHNEKES